MRWWSGLERERFWLEATDRKDIGTDLRAPYANASGKEEWRYGLFREARPGDIVFHYDSAKGAITSVSRVAGEELDRPIVWVARGSYARDRGAQPEELPGYFIPLDQQRRLNNPVTLEQLRARQDELTVMVERLTALHRAPLYFPFAGRPFRLNQGYAFKLPADFVAAFDALADAAGDALVDREPLRAAQVSPVRRAVVEMETAAHGYDVGKLQELRRTLRNMSRVPGRRIFSERTTFDRWAFHNGGRGELQFNIGIDEFPDGAEAMRVGVAFSLEPSQSLPDWRVLIPRMARFNDFLREQPEAFADLSMWDWAGDVRSRDRAPGPVEPDIVKQGTFVFLGARQPVEAFDAHKALRVMDRLLALYVHVQSGSVRPPPPVSVSVSATVATSAPTGALRLDLGVTSKTTGYVTASYAERTLSIFLRHNEIQNRLKARLQEEGFASVLEAKVGQRAIDAAVQHGDELWFYEVKTATTARQCIREAVGQLLEYAFWPGGTAPTKLVVVGEPATTDETEAYLGVLNARFPVRLEYRQVVLD